MTLCIVSYQAIEWVSQQITHTTLAYQSVVHVNIVWADIPDTYITTRPWSRSCDVTLISDWLESGFGLSGYKTLWATALCYLDQSLRLVSIFIAVDWQLMAIGQTTHTHTHTPNVGVVGACVPQDTAAICPLLEPSLANWLQSGILQLVLEQPTRATRLQVYLG